VRRSLALLVVLVLAAAAAAIAIGQTGDGDGRTSTERGLLGNGRDLNPVGKITELGNLPAGAALTNNGRFLWTLSAGRGPNDIRVVRMRSSRHCRKGRRGARCRKRAKREIGRVVQVIPVPGVSGGIAMAPRGRTVYVSGTPEGSETPEGDIPGREGDVVHVFRYAKKSGRATRAGVIEVRAPSDAPPYQDFPPNETSRRGWPRDLAVTPDGKTLLAALNLADRAAIVDIASKQVRYATVGHYPYGAAIDRSGKLGFVASESEGKLSVIDLASGDVTKEIQVGPRLSHPEGMAIDPKADRLYVAIAHQDLIAVVDTRKLEVERTLSVERPQGLGTTPTELEVTRDGCRLLSADANEDAVAIFSLPGRHCGPRRRQTRTFKLLGRIPTGAYPTAVAATPDRKQLAWVSAKGVGSGPNTNPLAEEDPGSATGGAPAAYRFDYLPSHTFGTAGILPFPSDKRIRKLTPRAARQIVPTNTQQPPEGTPISDPSAQSKIKHVFYIVRENRTYDQVLGDDPRGDGDPSLALFKSNVTPNLHALAQRFPLLDHVYANSEASIDGHYWTAAGAVSDYVVKNWNANYGGRGRPYDFGSTYVTAPPRDYIFQRADDAGVSYFNFGEALANLGQLVFPDKDSTNEDAQRSAKVLQSSDVGTPLPPPYCYESDISNSTVLSQGQIQVYDSSLPAGADPGAKSRFDCFKNRFQTQLATNSVPDFTYIVLPNDHTEGTVPGRRTPNAQIASNDYGLGQMVDLISHSNVWDSSAILVVEDDSQDGADHVDAHRMPALVISPYAKKGAVVHTRYDHLSFLKTLEIIVGIPRVNLSEALAVPLYDAFDAGAGNGEPYDAILPEVSLTEKNTAASPDAKLSSRLPLDTIDRVPQRTLDRILWHYVHGQDSAPPPPGPNASGIDEAREEAEEEAGP
jgi:DNA-binding beta-propeller fold protein YncE